MRGGNRSLPVPVQRKMSGEKGSQCEWLGTASVGCRSGAWRGRPQALALVAVVPLVSRGSFCGVFDGTAATLQYASAGTVVHTNPIADCPVSHIELKKNGEHERRDRVLLPEFRIPPVGSTAPDLPKRYGSLGRSRLGPTQCKG